MADIGVLHEGIGAGGGAEAVGLHTLAALADAGHHLTLYTTGDPDLGALASEYEASVPSSVRVVTVDGPAVAAVNHGATLAAPLGVTDFPLLRRAVVERVVAREYRDRHDTLVCTHGEFAVDGAVEYVHFPYFSEAAMRRYDTRFDESLYPSYHRVCRAVQRRERDATPVTVTNSEWTAEVVEENLRREATVVYPPVETDAFDPPSWDEQEPGFVSVGRRHPLKRQHELVRVVDRLRERGVDTHLHLVGGVGSADYADQLDDLAADRSYLHVEGRVSRERLVHLLERHRYGLHGRRHEHFGIAVAEQVAAGALPFVHASGGQQEVICGLDALRYSDADDAVEKTAAVLADPRRQTTLRAELAESADRFDTRRFRRSMRRLVENTL
jgi:glycosyltransferase involved in cell wall biosynthesis